MYKLKNSRLLLTGVVILSFLVFLSLSPAIFKWVKGNASSAFLSIGSSNQVAISPDGKFAAYEVFENSNEYSIRLRQLINNAEITLIKLNSKNSLLGLNFYADSNSLFYTIKKETGESGEMFRMATNGTDSAKVLTQSDSEPRFSPDGNEFTYFLNHGDQSQKGIRIANIDGSNERLLIPFPLPAKTVFDWSPDGKSLAYISDCPEGVCVSEYTFADGGKRIISLPFQEIYSLQWLTDKSCFVVSGKERDSINSQIYKISYPKGDRMSVTVGFDNYLNLKMTSDSYLALAVKEKRERDLWVVSLNNPANGGKQITNFGSLYKHVSWSPDGTVLAVNVSNGIQQILSSDKNGNNFHELIFGKWNTSPFPSFDGKFFVYLSKGGVWRADINGENQKLISRIEINNYLLQNGVQITPDGKWLIGNFNDKDGKASLRKINIESGETVSLSEKPLNIFSISPDGKQLAYLETDEQNRHHIVVRQFENKEPTKQFDLPSSIKIDFLRLRWTKDNTGVAYNFNDDTSSNIRLQPMTGEAPKQLTSFTSQTIYDFDFSPDGNEIVCTRGFTNNEVIQMRNLR